MCCANASSGSVNPTQDGTVRIYNKIQFKLECVTYSTLKFTTVPLKMQLIYGDITTLAVGDVPTVHSLPTTPLALIQQKYVQKKETKVQDYEKWQDPNYVMNTYVAMPTNDICDRLLQLQQFPTVTS